MYLLLLTLMHDWDKLERPGILYSHEKGKATSLLSEVGPEFRGIIGVERETCFMVMRDFSNSPPCVRFN